MGLVHRKFVRGAATSGGVVSGIAVAIALLSAPAMAQDAPADAPSVSSDDDTVGGDVIVTGTRASLQSAIGRKKNAGTTVDSIVAEDIASFPDKNIGEALQRITGVQLERDFGEGVRVSIRGVEPDLNRVEINGVTTLGQGGGGQRGADFRELASELVKSIDVFKGFTADMTEGGIGGTVSIETRKPLELTKTLLALTASAQYLDVSDSIQPRGNFTFGTNKLLGGRLGVILNVTYDKNDTRNDYLRNTEWVRFGDLNGDNRKITSNANFDNITTLAGCGTIPTGGEAGATRADCQQQFYEFVPRIPRYGIWLRNDERISGIGTVQYQLTNNLDVYVEYQRNRRNNQLIDYNRSVDVTALSRIDTSGACGRCTFDDEGNLLDFYTAPTAPTNNSGAGSIFSTSKRDFKYVQESEYKTAGFNWKTDRFQLKGLAVKSKGTTVSESLTLSLNATVPGIHVSLDPKTGAPSFGFPSGFNPDDPASYATPGTSIVNGSTPVVLGLQYRPEEVDVTEDQYKLDADWEPDVPFLTRIEFGGQYRKSTSLRYYGGTNFNNSNGDFVPTSFVTSNVQIGQNNTELAFPVSPTNPAQGTSQFFTQEKFNRFLASATEFTPDIFFSNGSRNGLPDRWLAPNFNRFDSFFDTTYLNRDRVRVSNGFAQTPAHEIKEDIYAGYLKGNFETELLGMPISGNAGIRWVRTEDTATGSNTRRVIELVDPNNPTGATTTRTVSVDTISFTNSYTDWLPSFNLAAEIVPNRLIARFGVAKVMARPRPTSLVPNINCAFDDTGQNPNLNDSCTAGNPNLKPYRATQYDLNLGWYPNADTLLNAALFYKNIDTFIIENQATFGVDVFGDGQLFDVRQPINGAGAKVKGVELSAQTAFTFLPAPLDGFGTQLNYTYSTAEDVGLTNSLTFEDLPFPGLSKHNYSVIGYYDKGFLNARLAYTWRSKYLRLTNDRSGNPVFRDASGYLDGKITLRFLEDRLQFFIEGKNLTGTTERDSAGGIRTSEWSYPGKRFFAGISARY
jgi:TonB-dependent receptor